MADARARGIEAFGPYPADSVYVRAIRGEFDAVVAMFHDQGHIPVKVHGFEESVSVALGLPIVRTSVDHGTAFDIAGTGKADARSMAELVRVAAQICAGTWLKAPSAARPCGCFSGAPPHGPGCGTSWGAGSASACR